MFRYSECPICYNGDQNGYDENSDNFTSSKLYLPTSMETNEQDAPRDKHTRNASSFAIIRNRGCSNRSSDLVPRISALSKESGFQSSYSSTSSVYSGSRASRNVPGESASVSTCYKPKFYFVFTWYFSITCIFQVEHLILSF